jgi:hypothetical protein
MTTKTITTYSQRCDRCGTTRHGIDPHGPWGATINVDAGLKPVALPSHVDLCDHCAVQLVQWLSQPVEKAA